VKRARTVWQVQRLHEEGGIRGGPCRPGVEAGAQLLILLIFFQFITDDITNMHLARGPIVTTTHEVGCGLSKSPNLVRVY
jgi:hypothetical protein